MENTQEGELLLVAGLNLQLQMVFFEDPGDCFGTFQGTIKKFGILRTYFSCFWPHKMKSCELRSVRLPVSPFVCLSIYPELLSGTAPRNILICSMKLSKCECHLRHEGHAT